ncbi:MAG: glycoside hydrolase family 92 protein, partial [Bacteroidota bacterium]
MRNKNLISFTTLLIITMLGCTSEEKQPVDYVNPYIGNISHLLVPTYPTVHLPNSFLRVYPDRDSYTDISMNGLPLIVVNHRGSHAFHLSPFQGSEKDIRPVISYSYDNETITPYSWSVFLDGQQTQVNFGVSRQSAMYQIDFNDEEEAYLILNAENGMLGWNGEAIRGYRSVGNGTKAFVHLAPEQSPREVYV